MTTSAHTTTTESGTPLLRSASRPGEVSAPAGAATAAPATDASRITSHPAPNSLEVGVYPNTPMELYHRWTGASNSRLTKLMQSPAHLKAYLDEPPAEKAALRIGRAVHTTILEPMLFDGTFVVASQCTATKKGDGMRCTNGGTMLHAEQGWLCGVHQKGASFDYDMSKLVLPEVEYTACRRIREAVFAKKAAAALLSGRGEAELSIVWDDTVTGVRCKGRIDRYAPDVAGGTIVDVKSTRNASLREFERAIFTHGYHRQAAMYLDAAQAHGLPAKHFVIIAVEKEPPYAVAVYRLTEGAIDAGREQITPLLERYAKCVASNEWPGYPDAVQDIALPAYAWSQIDEEVSVHA